MRPHPKKLPLRTKVAWGFGGMADNFMINGLNTLALPVYNIGYGVSAVWLGIAMAVPRAIDAVSDPIMGNISDNTRSRWGRRRPYVLWGALIGGLMFPLLWLPPFGSDLGRILYFFIAYTIFALVYTVFVVPYTALGFELTEDYDERTRVIAWRMYLGLAGGLAMPWLYKLCLHPAFGGTELQGVRYIGPMVGAVIIFAGILPALLTREAHQVKQEPIKFKDAILYSFKNEAFRYLLVGYLVILTFLFLPGGFGLYLNIYYVCAGDKSAAATIMGWSGTLMTVAAAAGVFGGTIFSAETGKRKTMIIALATALVASASYWWTITPALPYLQLVSAFVSGLALQCAWLMASSMVADVCDEDELLTGLRREGVYSAVMGFAQKTALALVSMLSGFTLYLSGFRESELPTDDTMFRMRLMFVGLQIIGLLLAIAVFARFPITRAHADETRRQLEARAHRPVVD